MRLVALLLLIAQEGLPPVPPRMPVDEEPSAAACTFDAALQGAPCAYEATSGPARASDNSKAAADAGLRACASEARRDPGLRKDCEHAVATASLGPDCALATRLVDEQGRLTADAQGCVEELRLAISQTVRAAATGLKCCKCLEQAHCAVPASQCRSELADLMPGAALKSCLAKACASTCSYSVPTPPAKSPDPLPAAEHQFYKT